ncbi:MAG: ammonium transporter [Betaproteobacteria bacterium HGW-Betaproteobacteria-8]|nr:MAG: ammonium transporter [Betaproteobacteria bacterium HGW-Betaproteobacteria-8]
MKSLMTILMTAISLMFPLSTFADEIVSADAANTLWIVVAGAMVFLMQPGFAMLESGMVRAKNAVNVMMKNYMDICVGTLLFWLLGYGLMFGSNPSGWFGTDMFAMSGGGGIDYAVLFFQMMFAATAATIVSGAMAERTNYFGYLIGVIGITAIIYPVFGSWVWNSGGWLNQLGFIDFAGSTVVHSVGAWCALAGILILGPRLGRFAANGQPHTIPGHNLGYIAIGGFLLWFGWFGFNGGSTLLAGTDIGPIVLNTHVAGAAGALGALLMSALARQPALMTNGVNGSIGGLVAITAGCASMDIPYAALTGFIGGIVCVLGFILLEKLRYDDVVGAVSVHGFAGAWGTLAAGVFYRGDMFNVDIIAVQLLGIGVAFLWVFFVALLMYAIIARTVGLRVSPQHEQRGLDITEHGEVGYPEFNRDAAYLSEYVKDLKPL